MAYEVPIIADLSALLACPQFVFSTQVNAAGAVEITFHTLEKLTQDINGLISITRSMHIPEVAARVEHLLLIRSRLQRLLVPDPGYQQLVAAVNAVVASDSRRNQSEQNKANLFGADNFVPVVAVAGPNVGQLPNDFPANHADLIAWTVARVNNLLAFYNIQGAPNMPANVRKVRLLKYVCLGQ